MLGGKAMEGNAASLDEDGPNLDGRGLGGRVVGVAILRLGLVRDTGIWRSRETGWWWSRRDWRHSSLSLSRPWDLVPSLDASRRVDGDGEGMCR